jgi:thimet oligopeptidase
MDRSIRWVSVLLGLQLFACLPAIAQQRPLVQPPIWVDKPSIADFVKMEDAKLAAAEAAIAALSKVQGPHTIDNTVEPFDKAFMELDDAVGLAKLVREVHPEAAFRDKGSEYVSKAESARQGLLLNRILYDALAAVDLSKADEATKYYVERRLKMSRWAGVDRSDVERAKLKALQD